MNAVDVDIEHVDLDPPDEDEGDDEPCTTVFVSVLTADGMRYTANVQQGGEASPEGLVEMLTRTALGTARLHSPAAEKLLTDRLGGTR